MNLTELSIRRPSLIIVLFSVLLFMGVASYRSLPIEKPSIMSAFMNENLIFEAI